MPDMRASSDGGPTGAAGTPDVHTFLHHWQDEADAAFLYRQLAAAESDEKKRDVYSRLAEVEDRHVQIWAKLIADQGEGVPQFKPSARAHTLAWLGRRLGPGFLLPTRNAAMFRWCLENGLRVVEPMTLMASGLYNQPAGVFLPSILF